MDEGPSMRPSEEKGMTEASQSRHEGITETGEDVNLVFKKKGVTISKHINHFLIGCRPVICNRKSLWSI